MDNRAEIQRVAREAVEAVTRKLHEQIAAFYAAYPKGTQSPEDEHTQLRQYLESRSGEHA